MRSIASLALTLFVVALVAACGGGSAPTPTSIPPALEGAELFKTKGCATCHGDDGGGGSGPSILHHDVAQVTDKVRNSTGAMPAFDASRISDLELAAIAQFIAELEGEGHGHEELDHSHDHAH